MVGKNRNAKSKENSGTCLQDQAGWSNWITRQDSSMAMVCMENAFHLGAFDEVPGSEHRVSVRGWGLADPALNFHFVAWLCMGILCLEMR